MNTKTKSKLNSIRFKLWCYFILLAALIVFMIWGLMSFFFEDYFEQNKISATTKMATQIIESYSRNNDLQELANTMDVLSSASPDVYMRVETLGGDILIAPKYDGQGPIYKYSENVALLRKRLLAGSLDRVSYVSSGSSNASGSRLLSYACYLTENNSMADDFYGYDRDSLNRWNKSRYVLYIFTPLNPGQSTVKILLSQFIYVSFIAIVLASIIALYFSSRISRPLKNITRAAAQMGKGNYGVQFNGGKYTEIAKLADTLTHASRELEKTDMYQKDLIANVSHDLRTPLTMIKSYAEMIRDLSGDNPAKRQSHLAVIIEETDRLNTLVTDMLNLSRMQNRTIVLDYEDFDIKEVAESLLASYDILREQEGYNIQLNCRDSILVNGDKSKIKQVISNLVTNAVKFCGDDKKVIVNIKKTGRRMRCEVTDNGIGIPDDEINHVWERYYKSSKNHVRPIEGSGLGLSIVKEILSLHKAQYGVISKEGKGTTFWFEMDIVKQKKK
ncbi:MAG: HAMP domain-containing sensor histidine kinase [Eubacteriaceae bacterium]|nr:HAMP domain-containing sensor histidine kinase [Eubacteriaceae bacterium]